MGKIKTGNSCYVEILCDYVAYTLTFLGKYVTFILRGRVICGHG